MKKLIIFAAVALIQGCALFPSPQQQDINACIQYGYQPNTYAFSHCRQREANERKMRAQRVNAAMMQWVQQSEARRQHERDQLNRNRITCNSRRWGDNVTTTCH